MEKRVLLAVTLSFLVLAAYQYFFVKPMSRAARPPSPAVAESASPSPVPETGVPAAAPMPAPAGAPAPATVEAVVGDASERDIVVEGPAVRAVFSNRGAELKSWQLKRYLDEEGQPVDLVPSGIPPTEPRTFAFESADLDLVSRLRGALFRPSVESVTLPSDQRVLAFEYQDASGVTARKRFEFDVEGSPYLLHVSAEVVRGEQAVQVGLSSGPGLGDADRASSGGSFFSPSYYQKPQAIFQQDSSVTRLAAAKVTESPTHAGRFRYVGADDHYFLSALVPGDRNVRVDYRSISTPAPQGARVFVVYAMQLDQPWQDVRFFLGPKQFDVLAGIDRELVRTINFGIFDWLVVPLLRALNWLNAYIGNYGWSIIVLTIFINLAMWPLKHKSMVSMRKMQEIQPQVKAIQERYANLKVTDPARQKMNTELMNLYRERGVNPASGCVPMLLTMPVLFAFYSMLSQAIELRGAPFALWIKDLSVLDPYYVTPLLMGASMVWQQRMTPSTADPTQQKVMMFMPVMFTFMFLWAPSGLVIYWFVSNLFAIGQQMLTNRVIGPPPGMKAAARA